MQGLLTMALVAAGFASVIVAGAWLGAGTHQSLAGLFPAQAPRSWPHGVQEPDAPHFALDHAEALRPGTVGAWPVSPFDDDAEPGPVPEIVELYDRSIDRRRA